MKIQLTSAYGHYKDNLAELQPQLSIFLKLELFKNTTNFL